MNVPCLSISSSSVGKLPWSFRRIVYFDEPIDDYRLADRQRVSAFHIAAGPVRKFSSSSTLRKTPRRPSVEVKPATPGRRRARHAPRRPPVKG